MSLDQTLPIVKHQTTTRDAFLGGRLSVLQPAAGFRAGHDSVLLGAAVREGARTLLDLGSGVGVAALVALAHNGALEALLVDRDAEALALAQGNLEANGFAERGRTAAIDLAAPAALRVAAGIAPDRFDSVVANPPFFVEGTRAPSAARAGARHMAETGLSAWIAVAAAAVAPRGEVIFIDRAERLPALLAGFEGKLGAPTVLPLAPRPGRPARRVLVRGIKGSRAPLTLLATRTLHGSTGHGPSDEIAAVLEGAARLDW